MKRNLFLNLVVIVSLLAISPALKADTVKSGGDSGNYIVGSSLFSIQVKSDGEMVVKEARSPLTAFPNDSSTKAASSKALLDAWMSYYKALLNGDRTAIKAYSREGIAPEFAARTDDGSADLMIITSSVRDGTVRVILRWSIQEVNGVSIFHDCHIWTEVEPEIWKVKSMLRED